MNHMKILVVDDDLILLESIGRGLRNRGYKVVETTSGAEALRLIDLDNASDIKLVLADYIMPGMDGIGLLEKVREKYSSLPVIMMTAHWNKDVVIHAMRKRCNSFLEKPFTLDQLVHEIEAVI